MRPYYHYHIGLLLLLVYCIVTPALSQGHLWGVSARGGMDGAGVIFRTDADGSHYTVVKEFDMLHGGDRPRHTALVLADNGKLYGMTSNGGRYNSGVLFEYDPVTGAYARKVDFDNTTTGSGPVGNLVKVAGGKLYGTTS